MSCVAAAVSFVLPATLSKQEPDRLHDFRSAEHSDKARPDYSGKFQRVAKKAPVHRERASGFDHQKWAAGPAMLGDRQLNVLFCATAQEEPATAADMQ